MPPRARARSPRAATRSGAASDLPDYRSADRVAADKPSEVDGRFASPGYNGDRLTTEMWFGWGVGADTRGRLIVAFRVVNQDGAILVDRGRVTIA